MNAFTSVLVAALLFSVNLDGWATSVTSDPVEPKAVGYSTLGFDLEMHAGVDNLIYWIIALTSLGSIACWHSAVLLWRRHRQRHIDMRELAAQVMKLRSMSNKCPHPIFFRDSEARLVDCNKSYLECLSSDLEHLRGKKLIDDDTPYKLDPDVAKMSHERYLKIMHDRLPDIGNGMLIPAFLPIYGRTVVIFHWVFPCFGIRGNVIGLMGGWIDVSDRQQLVDQLKASQKEAEDANKAKTTFLATMSHEIRTPLNAVLGMLEMAAKRAEQGIVDRVSLDVASSAANGLVDLIGDILDIVRIESGQLSLSPGRANLRDLTMSVARIFDGVAQQKLLSLRVELDPLADCDVWVDALRLKQILSNLLSNAIKFTVSGEVHFSLRCVAVEGGNELDLIFNVLDTGIGISHRDQQRLFNPFTQVGNPNESTRAGSGLGLTITRTLCEMMNGQLSLISSLGRGTDVSVSLRMPLLEPIELAPREIVETVTPVRRLHVLVVDDYPANRMLLSQQLTYLGHEVTDAEDGAHGMRAWRRGRFDVVISDCHMPIMNGYDLVKCIRAEEARLQQANCLIIGLTANALPEEKQRCLDAGMDDCLFKPISLHDLSERLTLVEPQLVDIDHQAPTIGQGRTLDITILRQLARGDKDSVSTLLKDLSDSLDSDLKRVVGCYTETNLIGLAELAHRIKGGARIVDGQNVILHCNRLESVCEAEDYDAVDATVEALTEAIVTLIKALRDLY